MIGIIITDFAFIFVGVVIGLVLYSMLLTSKMIPCKKCKVMIDDNARYCPECGFQQSICKKDEFDDYNDEEITEILKNGNKQPRQSSNKPTTRSRKDLV